MEKVYWPDLFQCPRCIGHEHGLIYGLLLKSYRRCSRGHRATFTGGTIMQATNLHLTPWFPALFRIGQAQTALHGAESWGRGGLWVIRLGVGFG